MLLSLLSLLLLLVPSSKAEEPVDRIAFGSCLRESRPAPVFDAIVAAEPDVFVFLGDNVYADTDDPTEMQEHYDTLAAIGGFQKLKATAKLLWVWDDHDFGKNDAGVEWAFKWTSKKIMLDFIGEPADSDRRSRDGNYDALTLGPDGQRVQFILLDTRWFRTAMKRDPDAEKPHVHRRHLPRRDPPR